mmetsp:Transcript_1184/g.2355  ORF Transcript_1184/g.2355 Transcript_1184/m.2355 type:complete len:960 (+) Transcript_1184:35-2914(+)|eukprot:CAMPEP_0204366072 /NCGR_PEP_ID=MMETSP0469-20131031/42382_1 /ASSEMBLY_ACC=CAM_ASM_000384 /TAXON_ID=2969 /ORGANISM="Oxyrrhis marina" /LENGTH=959 /DNA_ID=CAMNT_0051355223 /DNA_START=5 /DNA_END=2884 /DNA_ORIENTATION=+
MGYISTGLLGLATAIPITLMSVSSCASYAQFVTLGSPMAPNFLAAANFFSAGFAALLTNRASHTPYMVSSADMTNMLFLRMHVHNIAAASLSDDELFPTLAVGLHVGSLVLAFLFWILGAARAAVALNYLPYSVTAGFLAMVGAAIVKGAWSLLKPLPGQSSISLVLGVFLACISFFLKRYGVPTNLSSVASIIISLTIFYTWVGTTGATLTELRDEGWLFPGHVEPLSAAGIFEWDWSHIRWSAVFPDGSCWGLAFVACVNRALTITGIESAASVTPFSIDDEMKSTGVATIGVALVGGVAMNPSAGMTSLCKEGAAGNLLTARLASVFVGLLQIAVWGSAIPLTNFLPRFLLGGLLMMMGVTMLVDWAWSVKSRVDLAGMAVVYAMVIVSLTIGLIQGISLGVFFALCITNIRFAQLEVLKYHVSGIHFRSGEVYSGSQRGALRKYGDSTQILGLTGFVFEGVAISLSKYIKEVIRCTPELDTLVLDCFSSQGINDSACAHLRKIGVLCGDHRVHLLFANVSTTDAQLLRQWNVESQWVKVGGSLTSVLADAEKRCLEQGREPVYVPSSVKTLDGEAEKSQLEAWLGSEAARELLQVGRLEVVRAGTKLTTVGDHADRIFVAVPGHSDMLLRMQTGTSVKLADVVATTHGAVCPAEALMGGHNRSEWVARTDSIGMYISLELCANMPIALPALLASGMHQSLRTIDQLSSWYTVNRGGGWNGVTFDAVTAPIGQGHGVVARRPRSSSAGGVASMSAAAPSAGRQVPDEVIPPSKVGLSHGMEKKDGMRRSESGSHLVAAVLEAEGDDELVIPKTASSEAMDDQNLWLNRLSASEGDNLWKNRLSALEGVNLRGKKRAPQTVKPLDDLFATDEEIAVKPPAASSTTPTGGVARALVRPLLTGDNVHDHQYTLPAASDSGAAQRIARQSEGVATGGQRQHPVLARLRSGRMESFPDHTE